MKCELDEGEIAEENQLGEMRKPGIVEMFLEE